MKAHVVAKAGLLVGICLWAQASCNGGGSDADDDDAAGSGASASAGSDTGASAGSGTGGTLGTGGSIPGTGGSSTSGAAGSGTGGSSTSGAAGSPTECGTTQCSNCIDDDGDGKIDGFDADCTGFIDNDEGSFATGIPGDNIDACKQDCFFDGNSGAGDDKCNWDLACDPANPGANSGCPYDPDKQNCPPPPSQACLDACMDLVPNGCDCFGCCAVALPQGGTRNVVLKPGCSYDNINDTIACPTCTPVTECLNPCERCELCVGKNEVPADCNGGTGGSGTGGSGTGGSGGGGTPTCPAGVDSCTPTDPCPGLAYCLTGCCVQIPK